MNILDATLLVVSDLRHTDGITSVGGDTNIRHRNFNVPLSSIPGGGYPPARARHLIGNFDARHGSGDVKQTRQDGRVRRTRKETRKKKREEVRAEHRLSLAPRAYVLPPASIEKLRLLRFMTVYTPALLTSMFG